MIQSAYSYVKQKKLRSLAVLTWFIILGKIQDGNYCWWRHGSPAAPPSIKYTLSCWEDPRLSTEGKIVSKYCNISKPPGRCFINSPCTTVVVWICAYPRGSKWHRYWLIKARSTRSKHRETREKIAYYTHTTMSIFHYIKIIKKGIQKRWRENFLCLNASTILY